MSDTPTQIGPYAIERRLGAGGMAECFIAIRRMQSIEQRVCLKRILPAYARDATARKLFQREANISARLRHANLVQVLDVGEDNGTPYLVMELVEGCDLDHVLDGAPGRRLSPELVGYLLSEISHGLHEAHGGDGAHDGVVHRDLSPSNVLLSFSGEVKVADFGIAKALSGDKATVTMMRGKFAYMAPEQLDGAPLDPRADMFALGVMGFEMLAGVRPFDAAADARLVLLIAKNERKSIDELAPSAPIELRETIEALLSPQKEKRPANGHAVVEMLAPMLPATVVARRQLGKLVTTANEARMAAAASEPAVASDAAFGATMPASAAMRTTEAPEAVPITAAATPMVVSVPITASRERTTERNDAPMPERARVRTGLVIGGGVALLALTIAVGLGAYVSVQGAGPASLVAAPATVTLPPSSAVAVFVPTPPAPASVIATTQTPTVIADRPPPISAAPRPPSTVASVVRAPPSSDTAAPSSEEGAARGTGHIHIVAIPWAQIWIDGRFMGRAPIDADLRPGSHRIGAGFEEPTVTRSVRVRAGGSDRIEISVDD